MRLIDLLNRLDREGTLSKLYQAGAATLAVYNQRELANHVHALLASPHYSDQPTRAVEATAQACRVSRRSVYRALRIMQQEV